MPWIVTVKPEHQRQHQTKHILCCWICDILQHVWSGNCKWFRMFPCHSLARYTHRSYWFEQWQMTSLLIIICGFFSNIPIIWKLVWLLYWRCSTYSSLAPFYSFKNSWKMSQNVFVMSDTGFWKTRNPLSLIKTKTLSFTFPHRYYFSLSYFPQHTHLTSKAICHNDDSQNLTRDRQRESE